LQVVQDVRILRGMKRTTSARPAVDVFAPKARYAMSGDITRHVVKAAKACTPADVDRLYALSAYLFMWFPLSSKHLIVDADLAGVAPEAAEVVFRAAKATDTSKREKVIQNHMVASVSGSRAEAEAFVGTFGRA
jgi:hypothetical protein